MESPQSVNGRLDSIKELMAQASGIMDIYIRGKSTEDASELAVLQVIEGKICAARTALGDVQKKNIGTQNGRPIYLLHSNP